MNSNITLKAIFISTKPVSVMIRISYIIFLIFAY